MHVNEQRCRLLIIFGFYFCIGSLALMNAIIGVVVECPGFRSGSRDAGRRQARLKAFGREVHALRSEGKHGEGGGGQEEALLAGGTAVARFMRIDL